MMALGGPPSFPGVQVMMASLEELLVPSLLKVHGIIGDAKGINSLRLKLAESESLLREITILKRDMKYII